MMSVSRIALGAALALGCSAVLVTTAAEAQRAPRGNRQQQQQEATVQVGGRALALSAEERTALVALDAAARGADRAAQDAALAAAQPVARSADARYAFGRYQLQLGLQRNDVPMQTQALETLIASGSAPAEEMPVYLSRQFELAQAARDFPRAERALSRLIELRPNDIDTQVALAQLRISQRNVAEGLPILQRAIAARQASGQPVPESWLRYALAAAYDSPDARVKQQSLGFARTLVTAYPTPVNWRDALTIYREVGNLDAAASLDVLRLARVAGALNGERDYGMMAEALNQSGLPGEAKAVLDEGVRARQIDAARSPFREMLSLANQRIPADRADLPSSQRSALAAATGVPALRTGDAFLGYARYPEAIALYQAALQKGGVDANVANTRLGIALALAGRRPEAEAAFRAVTGARADVAALWLLWLSQRSG